MSNKTLFLLKFLNDLTEIEYTYDHFAEGECPEPPFIAYLCPRSHNFGADGIVYYPIQEINIEVYTDRKFPRLERLMELLFEAAEIFYEKTEVWIASERLYEVVYSFEEGVNESLGVIRQKFIDEFPELEERIKSIATDGQTIADLQRQIDYLLSLHDIDDPVWDFAETGESLPETGRLFLNTLNGAIYTFTDDGWNEGRPTVDGERYASLTDHKIYTSNGAGVTGQEVPNGGMFLNKADGYIYVYDAKADEFVKASKDDEWVTETHTLTEEEIEAKAITLEYHIKRGKEQEIELKVANVQQEYGVDFIASGNLITWGSKGLEDIGLQPEDIFTIQYVKESL